MPPNGQGIATLQILNILEGFDLRAMGRNSPDTLHAMIEAKKLAWADRAKFYADPAFAKIPLAGLLSKSYAAERRKLIDPNHAAKTVEAGNPVLGQGDTIYMCTADDEGNMVSLIQSNYRGMGSGIVVPGLGFMFQDRGELFSMEPGHANVYAPGKRPFHTIIPGFVMKDGKPWEAFGVMGGGMQPQGHVQVLTNQIDFGMNVQEAGDAARWQHEGDNEPTGEKMENGGYVEARERHSLRNRARTAQARSRRALRCRRLRRLPGDQSRDARRPTRLRRRERIAQGRPGRGILKKSGTDDPPRLRSAFPTFEEYQRVLHSEIPNFDLGLRPNFCDDRLP